MTTIQIHCPESVLLSLHESKEHFAKLLCFAGAAKLYELGRLSSGRAAELCGLSRIGFFEKLSEFGIPLYQEDAEGLERDVKNA